MPTAARPRVVAGLRLLSLVGQGAEGEVWEARDARGRRRALKLIRPDSLVEPEEVQRRGAWLVQVEHAALARVWRTGVLRGGGLDGWGFVEMAFVDGHSLQRASAMHDACARLAPLAEALDLLHAGAWSQGRPLVHRDVKPANLIETPDARLVLVDHSTLRALGGDTITRIGTPVFAAPEVMSGRMGPPADVYSFCATAVALVSGQRGEALARLLAAPEDLDLPGGLEAGLRARPEDRPPSCRAALEPAAFALLPPDLPAPGAAEPRGGQGQPAHAPDAAPVTETFEQPILGTGDLAAAHEPTSAMEPASGTGWDEPPGPVPAAGSVATARLARVPSPPPETRPAGTPPAEVSPSEAPAVRDATAVYGQDGGPLELAAPAGPRHVLGWVLALAVLALALPLAALLAVPLWPETAVVVVLAALVHLLCHALHGRHQVASWVAPPLAWAFLLAERAAPAGRRRDWARPLLLGALLALSGALLLTVRVLAARLPGARAARLLAEVPGQGVTAESALACVLAALALVALSVYAARRGGLPLRLALLPLWAFGALLLLAGGVLLCPLALLTGRAGALLRLLGRTVTGTAAIVRPDAPPAAPAPAPPVA